MGYMVKPGMCVNFDGAVLTPEKSLHLTKQTQNFTTALDEGQEYRNVMELVRGSTNAKIELLEEWIKTLQVCYCLRTIRHDS
jgi:23S rRNA pseudouridine2605 synthase